MVPPWILAVLLAAAHADDIVPAERRVRAEYFLVEEAPAVAQPHEDAVDTAPVALVAWRHVRSESSELLERDVYFREDGIRIRHSERLVAPGAGGSPRLVFRELRRNGGRTWLAELDRAQRRVEITGWGGVHALHEVWHFDAGVQMPLALLELVRAGLVSEGRFECLDPLVGGAAAVFVTTHTGLAGVDEWVPPGLAALLARGAADRTVELRRGDGGLAGRFVFRGRELLAFQWQAGGAWAHRIDEAAYRRLLESWLQAVEKPQSVADLLASIGR